MMVSHARRGALAPLCLALILGTATAGDPQTDSSDQGQDSGQVLRDVAAAASANGSAGGGGGTASAGSDMGGSTAANGIAILGDRFDPNSGALSFSHVDVSIPGNSGLEVAIRRTISQGADKHFSTETAFGDWVLDIPRLSAVMAGSSSVSWCANGYEPQDVITKLTATETRRENGVYRQVDLSTSRTWKPETFWQGVRLHVPGGGAQHLLDGAGRKWGSTKSTVSHWSFTCGSDGSSLIGYDPNGNRYTFNKKASFSTSSATTSAGKLTYRVSAFGDETETLYQKLNKRIEVLYPTQVTDVNGNWVKYEYSGKRLSRIHSNDGREIRIGGTAAQRTVTANGRTWTYFFNRGDANRTLTRVVLPDGRDWTFSGTTALWSKVQSGTEACSRPSERSLTVKHPDGMSGTFTVGLTKHGRINVPEESVDSIRPGSCATDARTIQRNLEFVSLKKKTLSGPGVVSGSWDYIYSEGDGAYNGSINGRSDLKWVQVSGPNDYTTRTYVNRRWGWKEGLVEKVEVYASRHTTNPLQITDYYYERSERFGDGRTILPDENRARFERGRYPEKVSITRGSDWWSTAYEYTTNQGASDYSYGFPTEVRQYGLRSGSERRVTKTTYQHDRSRSIYGLPRKVERNGKTFDEYTYDSFGRVKQHHRFGVKVAEYGYHSSGDQAGTMAWMTDALGYRTAYKYWKRGTPEEVLRPDGVKLVTWVDSNGWVGADFDALGRKTTYEYEAASGRLKTIDRPGPLSSTTVTYTNVGSTSSHMLESVTRGHEKVTTHYNAKGQPVLAVRYDLSGKAQTTYQRTEYDAYGRMTRAYRPTFNDSIKKGIEYSYDALGRLTQERENVSPHATTKYQYWSKNRVVVTDPKNQVTKTTRRGYGSPDNGNIRKIEQPSGTTTEMDYDVYGNLKSARQFGTSGGVWEDFTQRYHYDSRLRLCRHHTSEQGSTIYRYDNANQLKHVARGQGGWSSSCGSLPAVRVNNSYDRLGRLDYVDYTDGTPDVDYRYDANGNLYEVYRGGTRWSYRYHPNADLLIEETLRIDGKTFRTDYAYDGHGRMTGQTKRSSTTRAIHFAPDGWGRPTQAKLANGTTYARDIDYHASGAVKSLTYGNGHVYEMLENARQLPDWRRVRKGGSYAMQYRYRYDANGRIDYAWNDVVGNDHRDYTYDAQGRLKQATIGGTTWGYQYDAVGNLLEKRVGGGLKVDVDYDDSNRLSRYRDLRDGGSWRTYRYDARGNVTNDGLRGFTYDLANQPTRMTGGVTGTYAYDGNYKRVKAVHAGTLSSGGGGGSGPAPDPCRTNPFAPGCEPMCGDVFCDRTDGGGGLFGLLGGGAIEGLSLGKGSGSGSETIYSVYGRAGTLLHQRKQGTGGTIETDYVMVAGMVVAKISRAGSTDTVSHPHTDHLGTTVVETSAYGGILWREKYSPFGERMGSQAAANNNHPSFTGHVEDARSKLTYMEARFHDPVVGRFLSTDPVQLTPSMPSYFGRYTYTANDPINLVDPDGQFWGAVAYAFGSFVYNSLAAESGASFSDFAPSVQVGFGQNQYAQTGSPTQVSGPTGGVSISSGGASSSTNVYGPVTGSDGYLSYNEAAYHYIRGNGSDVWVNASLVDFGRTISRSEFGPVDYSRYEVAYVAPKFGTESFIVHGTLQLRLAHSGTQAYIVREEYNFEMHEVNGLEDVVRNLGTIAGHASHGYRGTSFYINYLGFVPVGP